MEHKTSKMTKAFDPWHFANHDQVKGALVTSLALCMDIHDMRLNLLNIKYLQTYSVTLETGNVTYIDPRGEQPILIEQDVSEEVKESPSAPSTLDVVQQPSGVRVIKSFASPPSHSPNLPDVVQTEVYSEDKKANLQLLSDLPHHHHLGDLA